MDSSIVQGNKSAFKKKMPYNFADNSLMNSTVRPQGSSFIPEEKYIALEKELKKLKKTHTELIDQYKKMKNACAIEKVKIQLDLHEAHQMIASMTEQKAMLINRIDFLEKESASQMRNYQRPLNRSMLRSNTPGNKSRVQKENANSLVNFNVGNDTFGIEEKLSKPKSKTNRSLHDEASQNQADEFDFSSNIDSIPEIKLNQKCKKQSPLIKQEKENEENFCGSSRCIKYYNELQQMKENMGSFGNYIEDLYLQLEFAYDKNNGLKELADYEKEILKLCEQDKEENFSKIKPKFMMKKIQRKVREIMSGPKQTLKNRQIEELKERIRNVIRSKEEMEQNGENEAFNYEAGTKEIERIKTTQKQLFAKMRKTFGFEEEESIQQEEQLKIIEN